MKNLSQGPIIHRPHHARKNDVFRCSVEPPGGPGSSEDHHLGRNAGLGVSPAVGLRTATLQAGDIGMGTTGEGGDPGYAAPRTLRYDHLEGAGALVL
jgi:hypothetical protein